MFDSFDKKKGKEESTEEITRRVDDRVRRAARARVIVCTCKDSFRNFNLCLKSPGRDPRFVRIWMCARIIDRSRIIDISAFSSMADVVIDRR